MCDQTPLEYKDGDIVWVKLSSCWWPGEVQDLDKLPEEWFAELKKRPIAAVKFFDEDTYEYVKSIDKIYSYNCTKKNDFIRRGLDLYRAKNAFMEKFPSDLITAEKRTDGDPNIIDDPMFTPERKTNIASLIFGSPPKPKKSSKRTSGSRRSSHGKYASPSTSSKATPSNKLITHPRFLGYSDDHEVRILLQSPEKTAQESQTIDSSYNCTTCGFKTTRIDVIILHNKSHIQGVYSTPTTTVKKGKKAVQKKGKKSFKMTRSKTSSIVEDLELIEKGILLTTESSEDDDVDDDWDEPKPKRRRKKNRQKSRKSRNKKEEEEEEAKIDIRDNLLAEWEDDSEGEENPATISSTTAESDASVSKVEETNEPESKVDASKNDFDKSSVVSDKDEDLKKDADKSCFDFEEDEEEKDEIVGTSVGRKIPRVIPPSDKQKTDSDQDDGKLPPVIEENIQMEQLDDLEGEIVINDDKGTEQTKPKNTDDEAFKDILNSTAVPDLPEIPHPLKFEQNFHDTKTIKFPDKSLKSETTTEDKEEQSKSDPKETSETSAKLINPKKRFVKSFEDFEQQLNNEQKKTTEPETSSEKLKNIVELSKLKTQLMSKLENAQQLLPKESSPRKHSEKSKQSRTKERISDKDDDDDEDDDEDEDITYSRKKATVTKTRKSRSRLSEPLSPKSKPRKEIKSPKSAETKKVQDKMPDDVKKSHGKVSPTKTRRLSVKTPEVKETVPLDIEETTELLETTEEVVQIEQVELLEEKQSVDSKDTLQVESVVTEVQEVKSQQKESDVSNSKEDSSKEDAPSDDVSLQIQQNIEVAGEETLEDVSVKKNETDKSAPKDNPNQVSNDPVNNELNNGVQQYVQNKMPFSPPDTNEVTFRVDKNTEDLSALTTLATVSELTTNFDIQSGSPSEKSKLIEENLSSSIETHTVSEKPKGLESFLTFVTEDDLADGQVEIADVSETTKRNTKPVTLTSFSVDYPETTNRDANVTISIADNSKLNTSTQETPTETRTNKRKRSQDLVGSDVHEKAPGKLFATEEKVVATKNEHTTLTMADFKSDVEDQVPSLVMRTATTTTHDQKLSKPNFVPEYTSSSKLLEILTDGKPKLKTETHSNVHGVSGHSNKRTDTKFHSVVAKESTIAAKNVPKFDPKNSKFIIKSAISNKLSTTPSATAASTTTPSPIPKASKPIILSEKIIKSPIVTTELESVSVQKVTSKRATQDIEDIDTFIIKKPTKRLVVCNEPEPIPNNQPLKKSIAPRGKAKILQQTIIKPTGDIHTTSLATTSLSQTTIDDGMFDINSMPIVLGDQILTAENIENMPVVLSDTVQPTTFTITTGITTATKNISSPSTATVSKPQTEQVKLLNKMTTSITTQPVLVKTYSSQKFGKNPRIYQTSGTKLIKNNPAIITRPGKPDKFIIVPPGSSTATGSKYTVGKRQPMAKRPSPVILPTPSSATPKIQNTVSPAEPTGNKIMIVTNQQGQQSRVLLTPAQQKLLGYQNTGSKLVKNTLKGNILQKVSNTKSTILSSPVNASKISSLSSHTLVSSNQNIITSDGQVLVPVKSQLRNIKTSDALGTPPKSMGRKLQMQSQKVLLQEGLNTLKTSTLPGQQKTIVIKNQQGQIVKRIQGTDDALLEQQVAEQVQAIKASGSFASMKTKQDVGSVIKPKPPVQKRSFPKKPTMHMEPPPPPPPQQRSIGKPQVVLNTSTGFKSESPLPPPLAPISPKKTDSILTSAVQKTEEIKLEKQEQVQQKPLNQLIIQDAHGNQTTITEGQILALPSETIDGQPQSYMLVTLDESGNLAPLNNEALLSLDPNLCLGGDLSNMVLQIDDGSAASLKQENADAIKSETSTNSELQTTVPVSSQDDEQKEKEQLIIPLAANQEQSISKPEDGLGISTADSSDIMQHNLETVQTVTCSIGNDPNQQLIITGDPISTQKFIESLTEGNPDLANLLASAEGNILIQTDEQQILINTDADNQVLLPMNTESLGVLENSEGDGNPIFATQPAKNQDILAAALADTDVFQQDQSVVSPTQSKIPQSQLSPNSGLYPGGVSNVLGTTLSLSSPIMTPLEVPSTNNKKIPDEESDILTTEVPKNVDLPITITDPNISQTVAQQQVASLIANELTGNLDLPLTITDQGVPLTSAEMNSPSYVFSLPNLDESVDINQKAFSGPISMPLLTEEPQEVNTTDIETSVGSDVDSKIEIDKVDVADENKESTHATVGINLPNSSNENLHVDSPSIEETSATLFETSSLPVTVGEKLDASGSFLGTTLETEEGLCTLGGAICSSLSEPPPDMFDLSVVNRTFGAENRIKEDTVSDNPETSVVSNISDNSTVSSCPSKSLDSNLEGTEPTTNMEEYDKFEEGYDGENRNDSTPSSNVPLNSESSSPAVNIDENSCEIPVQPQIVTDLSSSSSFEANENTDSVDYESNKRTSTSDISNEKKKLKFD